MPLAESPRHPGRAQHQHAVLRGKPLIPRSSRRRRQEGRRGGAADIRRTFEYMERRRRMSTPPVEDPTRE
eukprot:6243664-Pyramimonas_sp.AAC.1